MTPPDGTSGGKVLTEQWKRLFWNYFCKFPRMRWQPWWTESGCRSSVRLTIRRIYRRTPGTNVFTRACWQTARSCLNPKTDGLFRFIRLLLKYENFKTGTWNNRDLFSIFWRLGADEKDRKCFSTREMILWPAPLFYLQSLFIRQHTINFFITSPQSDNPMTIFFTSDIEKEV